ncbi:MAG: DUF1697 domain-containing protein [Methanobacteriota archaeon]
MTHEPKPPPAKDINEYLASIPPGDRATLEDLCVIIRAVSPEVFKTDLKPFKVSGTTIHFSASHPLPTSLVTAIVRARIAENGFRTSQDGQVRHQYVAFLRGINVGGYTPIKMRDLTSAFQARGFENVQTMLPLSAENLMNCPLDHQ